MMWWIGTGIPALIASLIVLVGPLMIMRRREQTLRRLEELGQDRERLATESAELRAERDYWKREYFAAVEAKRAPEMAWPDELEVTPAPINRLM